MSNAIFVVTANKIRWICRSSVILKAKKQDNVLYCDKNCLIHFVIHSNFCNSLQLYLWFHVESFALTIKRLTYLLNFAVFIEWGWFYFDCVLSATAVPFSCDDGMPFSSDDFACKLNHMCIPRILVCDGDNDCGDNSDEENCKFISYLTLSCVAGCPFSGCCSIKVSHSFISLLLFGHIVINQY